jgi:hypothetical protein
MLAATNSRTFVLVHHLLLKLAAVALQHLHQSLPRRQFEIVGHALQILSIGMTFKVIQSQPTSAHAFLVQLPPPKLHLQLPRRQFEIVGLVQQIMSTVSIVSQTNFY